CRFSDIAELPPDGDRLEELFEGPEGLREYFEQISYGKLVPEFRRVETWVTLPYSQEVDRTLSRYERIERCVDAHVDADPELDPNAYFGIIVVRNSAIDGGAAGNVLADAGGLNVTFLAHEMSHILGLGHSWDMSDRQNASWSSPGEYFDHWDIMSAMAVFSFRNANGFTAGTDMAASFKMGLGWLGDDQVTRLSLQDIRDLREVPVRIGAWDRGDANEALTLVIDGLPGGEFYTAELRKKRAWDRSIPEQGLLIHLVKSSGNRPYVIDGGTRQPGEEFLSPEGLRIEVLEWANHEEAVQLRLSMSSTPATPMGEAGVASQPLMHGTAIEPAPRLGSEYPAPPAPMGPMEGPPDA
ncbi:MAG: hypothetical protein IT285_01785, partial [Bdellovibrionales bacterium]|nr:hypothetical protein [Bdellovibrionales bacterium]